MTNQTEQPDTQTTTACVTRGSKVASAELVQDSPVVLDAPRLSTQPVQRSMHSVSWEDEYFWLIDPESEVASRVIASENCYADSILQTMQALEATLEQELRERVDEVDESVPVNFGQFVYWSRYQAGHEYAQHCRRAGVRSLLRPQSVEVFLDENEVLLTREAELGDWAVSPDHRYVIATVDATGEESYGLIVRHITSGRSWIICDNAVGPELCWSRTADYFFYTRLDDQGRVAEVVSHQMGHDYRSDVVVYSETDPHFEIGIERSRDERSLVITTVGDDSSEVWLLDIVEFANSGELPDLECVQPRAQCVEYYVEPQADRLIILTNDYCDSDGEFAVMTASRSSPSRGNWKLLLAPEPGRHYEWVVAFKNCLLLHETVDGRQCYRVIEQKPACDEPFSLMADRPTEQIEFVDEEREDATTIRVERSSLSQPERIEQHDLISRVCSVLREDAPDETYDRDDYAEERIEIPNGDVLVPVSIVYRKSSRCEQGNPLVLYGYGAYETGVDTNFDVDRLSLLDRGVIYAIAHVRGGDEKGRAWYDAGRCLNKENSFSDFLAVARGLVDRRYTSAGKIVIQGESAGGLLVACCVNRAPELFAGVVAEVPFVDVVETMSNTNWPTTTQDYDEFGNPMDPDVFNLLREYCPYQNVRQQHYPPMYVTSSVNDQRVPWWEALRWVTRLRQQKTDNNTIILKIAESAGHQGLAGRTQEFKQTAQIYAFILRCLNIA